MSQLTETLSTLYPDIQKRYGLRSMAIFGSRIRGDAKPDSDLDILVEFENPPGLFRFQELEEELAHYTGLKVDLVMKSALKQRLGTRILSEAVPVHPSSS